MIFGPKAAATALVLTLLAGSSPARALTCLTNVDEFDFTTGSPTTFSVGAREDVDRAYARLRSEIGDLSAYNRTTIFISRDYDHIVRGTCTGEKCSGSDLQSVIEQCLSEGGKACHPLAVAYQQTLYCLLSPGQETFDPSVPFVPYVPYER